MTTPDTAPQTAFPAGKERLPIGQPYHIAWAREAVTLAHSSHGILSDPDHSPIGTSYQTLHRRLLFRVGDHPLRDAFEGGLGDQLCALVAGSGFLWTMIGAYRQGFGAAPEENVPTILIMARPQPVTQELLSAAQRLVEALEPLVTDRLPDVHIDISMMNCAEAYASEEPPRPGQDMAFMHDPVWPGNSVGPAGQTASGTLTGCVRIENATAAAVAGKGAGPRADVFGLTCHHVASSGRADLLAPLSEADGVGITSPSPADHGLYVAALESQVQYNEEAMAKATEAKERFEIMERPWPTGREAMLQWHADRLASTRATLEHALPVWQQGAELGSVLLSTGIRAPAPGESVNDWALIRLDAARMQRQRDVQPLPTISKEYLDIVGRQSSLAYVPGTDVYHFFGAEEASWLGTEADRTVPREELQELIRARREDDTPLYVFLRGRTTAFGIGILHDVCDRVHTRYMTRHGAHMVVSRERTVLPIPPGRPNNAGSAHFVPFSDRGDAGAKARLADGRILGVVVGSNNHDELGRPSSHLTEAQTLLDRIAAATGASRVSFVGMDQAV